MDSFKGGVLLQDFKQAKNIPIQKASIPKKIIIPLRQHIGVECKPIVDIGDFVKAGELIGIIEKGFGAKIHSSISGKVIDIGRYPNPINVNSMSIVIEGNGNDDIQTFQPNPFPTKEELIKIVEDSGIVGLGGAMFPTHIKLSSLMKTDCKIDCIIINGAECEPYLCCDYRLMIEKAEELTKVIKLIADIFKVKIFIGIEDNKKSSFDVFNEKIKRLSSDEIKTVLVKTKYPQGAEKILIKTLLGKEVPPKNLPLDIGVIVLNIGTLFVIYEALFLGKPLIERIITVSGNVKKKSNLLVRIGTPISDVLSFCEADDDSIIIAGGPMMGLPVANKDMPIMKGTSGITLLEYTIGKEGGCIRCASCLKACPVNLNPTLLSSYSRINHLEMIKKLNIIDCYECGCCNYVCPANIPLVQNIKIGKANIMKNVKKN